MKTSSLLAVAVAATLAASGVASSAHAQLGALRLAAQLKTEGQ